MPKVIVHALCLSWAAVVAAFAPAAGPTARPLAPPLVRAAVSPSRSAVAPSMDASAATMLVANGAVEQIDVLLEGEVVVAFGLIAAGFGLNAFADVDEPKEPGAEEGSFDIYRDSLLRYCGYANEVGEAFRPLVPVEIVYFSYVIAITYILADTFDKGKKGAEFGGAVQGTLGALDTFSWQMLASVMLPSFIINRIVVLFASLQFEDLLPGFLEVRALPRPLHWSAASRESRAASPFPLSSPSRLDDRALAPLPPPPGS